LQVEFQLSPAQLDEIKMIFNINDKNKDGMIDVREFKEYCKESGYDMDEVAVLFDQSDVNGDGLLSFDEFLEIVKGAYMPLDYDLAY
jgi:Ca2+-binding EF-hand superfamily protein